MCEETVLVRFCDAGYLVHVHADAALIGLEGQSNHRTDLVAYVLDKTKTIRWTSASTLSPLDWSRFGHRHDRNGLSPSMANDGAAQKTSYPMLVRNDDASASKY
ncbi:hypothetical protein MCC02031_07250 [Bifidobacteriaceae bacterium MCC02031]|nr:hypothetical protein MCC02031_07250 [Bifidobacteriaceae bacterium MCC02031]